MESLIALYSSEECFGIHLGDPQSANLGDGNGWVNQTIELRQDFGLSSIGTCFETLVGGNHFRQVAVTLLLRYCLSHCATQIVPPERSHCKQRGSFPCVRPAPRLA